jgi:hypothetical protein
MKPYNRDVIPEDASDELVSFYYLFNRYNAAFEAQPKWSMTWAENLTLLIVLENFGYIIADDGVYLSLYFLTEYDNEELVVQEKCSKHLLFELVMSFTERTTALVLEKI